MERTTDSDHDLLLGLHGKVTEIGNAVDAVKAAVEKTSDDHETRIRNLESFKSTVIGALLLSNTVILPILTYLFIKAIG